MKKHYKIISLDLQKKLIEFLDEIQFDAAGDADNKESMHIINFCSYAIKELMDSFDGYLKDISEQVDFKPKKKPRDQYVDETFMDWNLPDMTDEEYEKLVDQFDGFLRSWEKEYNKKNKDNPKIEPIQERPYKPDMDDVMEFCDLGEVIDFLKDDPELSPEERFDLYYDERERRKPKKKESKGLSYNQLLKKSGIENNTKEK